MYSNATNSRSPWPTIVPQLAGGWRQCATIFCPSQTWRCNPSQEQVCAGRHLSAVRGNHQMLRMENSLSWRCLLSVGVRGSGRFICNVPSKMRGCAAAHLTRKHRAEFSNYRAAIFNAMCVIYIWWKSSCLTLDFRLESGDWMYRSRYIMASERWDWFRCCIGWHLWKKMQVLRNEFMCRSNTILFRAHWKKQREHWLS